MQNWMNRRPFEAAFKTFDVTLLESGNITNFSLYLLEEEVLVLVANKPHQWEPEEINRVRNKTQALLYCAQDEEEAARFLQLKELGWYETPIFA